MDNVAQLETDTNFQSRKKGRVKLEVRHKPPN